MNQFSNQYKTCTGRFDLLFDRLLSFQNQQSGLLEIYELKDWHLMILGALLGRGVDTHTYKDIESYFNMPGIPLLGKTMEKN